MRTLLVMIAAGLVLVGCGANAEQGPAAADTTPATGSTQMDATDTAAPSGNQLLTGKVAETMDGGGYTYIRITDESGDNWVAVPNTKVEVGQEITVSVQMTMPNFESTALNRTFESLAFATMGDAAAASPHGAMPGMGDMGMGMGHSGEKAQIDLSGISIEKASGANAKTVAELWAQRTDLKDSTVVVRGKVVKFLPSIMGRNWVHLRDGTGNDEKADNDITITTDATVTVGDIVVATGVVRIDKDLGAGYSYPVILEEGTFTN